MATSSSATKPRHLLNPYGTTAAPPPTPSTQPNLNHSSSSSDSAADTLSRLLHRLPPNLSLPSRLSPRATTSTTTTPTPTTPLPTAASLSPLPASAFELGYFQLQLTRHHQHSITPQLAESAESEALSLLNLPHDQKLTSFPRDWPLGFDDEDDGETASLCLDGACSTTATELGLSLTSLRELTRELEKVGLEVVESLASGVGFENPFSKKTEEPCSLMWISEDDDKVGRVYPYVVGVQYQIRTRKWSLLSDTGPVVVEPQVGSVFVTVGDIAQVWSNGKLKKVRGRPAAISEVEEKSTDPVARCISMTLLISLPAHESTVSPLLATPPKIKDNGVETESSDVENDKEKGKSCDHERIEASTSVDGNNVGGDEDHSRVFNSFSFEDYAWRVYHERFPLKDPLERYRVTD